MPQSYAPEFKKKIVRLHAEEGRTYKSITAEYGVSKASISKWCSEFSRECQTKALENPDTPNELELMKENLFLKKALESQPVLKGELILHSDQGSQFTPKAFVEFCESVHVTQSMSEAGYPYDNASMDCLSTSYRECSAYVKDKAAKGGAKHPLHTRNTPVISK